MTIIIEKSGGSGGVTLPINISDVTALQSELDAKTELPIAISDVTTLETTLLALGTDITTIEGDILALNTDVATNTSAILALNTDVTTIEGDILALNTDVTTLEGSVLALGTETITRRVIVPIIDPVTALDTDDVGYFRVTSDLSGKSLIDITGYVYTVGTTNATTISLLNGATNMLSTDVSIASTAVSGSGTINGANSLVTENDLLTFTVEGISVTAPIGLDCELIFRG